MSQQTAFDQLTEELSGIIARDLSDLRAEMKALKEEHREKISELRGLREQYRRQQADAIRREVSAARQVDREMITELRDELGELRRQLATRTSEYAR